MLRLSHFSLYGDFETQEITTALLLNPSWTLERGELLEGANSPARVATWDFYGPDEMGLNEQVEFLVTCLWARKEALRKLTARFHADLNLSFARNAGAETFTLKPDTLQKLASLSITLNCFHGMDEVEDGD